MQRIKCLDLARGFTVLFIAPIHTVMLYSKTSLYHTLFGYMLAFIAEGPGAQLFMLLMGIFFARSGKMKFSTVIQRVVQLLILAYALNVFKFVMPLVSGVMPSGMQSYLQITDNASGIRQAFLLGDILHFAALSLLILWLIRRIRDYALYALLLAVMICFISPALWDLHAVHPWMNYLLELTGGRPPHVFFPLLPWLIYPLLGMVIGSFLYDEDQTQVWGITGIIGALLLIAGLFLPDHQESFYRTYPGGTLYHIGIVFLWLYAWHVVSQHIPNNYFFRLLGYYSRHITLIYAVQWVIIAMLLPVFGFRESGLLLTFIAIILTSCLVLIITVIINIMAKQERKAKRRALWRQGKP